MKQRIIVSIVLGLLILISGCLKDVWFGFTYMSVSFLAALCLYWAAVFIYKYLETYRWNFEEDFAFYRAQVINASALKEEDFDMARDFYVKKFKRTQTRDKLIDVFKIIFCISFAITCVVAMSAGVIR